MGNHIGSNWKVANPIENLFKPDIRTKLGSIRQSFKSAPAEKFYKPRHQSLATPSLTSHTASPSIRLNNLRPLVLSSNEKISRPVMQAFTNIKEQSKQFYYALRESQLNIKKAISIDRRAINSDQNMKHRLDTHKLWRDAPNRTERLNRQEAGIQAYKEIQTHLKRPDSALEKLLPEDSQLRRDLFPVSGGLRDPKIGLYAELRELAADETGKKNYILCFIGTGKGAAIRAQMTTNVTQFAGVGGVPAAHKKALALTEELKKVIESQGGALSLTGHSLGGGICNYVGTKLKINSTCYNSAALGGGCLDDLKKSNSLSEENLKTQTHIRVKGDPVSSPRAQKIISFLIRIVTNLELKLPRHVGTIYEAGKSDFDHPMPGGITCHQLKTFDSLY